MNGTKATEILKNITNIDARDLEKNNNKVAAVIEVCTKRTNGGNCYVKYTYFKNFHIVVAFIYNKIKG